ncbi:cysteine desulfurase / selenocysteine lyase [Filimonas lacunae]|uniref:cysteine desulfurase n=1 Tax=Filimonas lacunae TaxID=477680 RepID=A0A173MGB6_9BACT|nr:family 2A encapsulin nanocompartment cargo protein cysteine desulfurase [Filimonas lacunae]BAV06643.1 cysteine desulfurase [Filimonas lacunae]SIT27728.1 cysteine desulfurase / selenocysteine lyase [Filimonas lacunae]
MSININEQTGLPDVNDLQHLANAFFKALPNEAPKEFSANPEEHPRAKAYAENVAALAARGNAAPPDFYAGQSQYAPGAAANPMGGQLTPPSTGGAGASAGSLFHYADLADIDQLLYAGGNESSHSFTPHHSNEGGRVPTAVAGSGASPSYLQQGNTFNIKEPETSFPDNNLQQKQQGQKPTVGAASHPFQWDVPSFFQLQNTHHPAVPVSFPLTGAPAPAPSFYFLDNSKLHSQEISGGQTSQLKHALGGPVFDAYAIKKDFPILVHEKVNGKSLVWLDNAATTQKPQSVIDRIAYFYAHENSNIHRAAHELAARATDAYETAREKVRAFLGAKSANEIIFVRGATEAINLVAQSWGNQYLKAGDEIIVSNLEHHANIVPWKRLADAKGLTLKVIPVDDDGQLLLDEYAKLLSPKTKLVAFTQVSNALGTVTPAQQVIAMAHAAGAKVLVDGAQSVSHMPVNVQALDADWFVFSGHKVFGPTGIGVVYGKEGLLNATEPWQGGGNMIKDVTFEEIQYHPSPNRFEAGTGNIADAVGLGAAIDYVTKLGMETISQYEHWLLEYATYHMKQIPGLRLIGTAPDKASVLSFNLKGFSNDQVGKALNQEGIAVRTGHHCAQPILRRMGVETSVRPSLAFYNTCEDVDRLVTTLWRLIK